MNNLKFDVEAAKEQLTQVFRDRISAQGSVYNLQNVNIEDVAFAELQEKIANQDALIADMKTDLAQAQTDGGQWFNDVQPGLTAIPQAAINYATLWNQVIPIVLDELKKTEPDRQKLQQLFGGLKDRIAEQIASLNTLMTSLKAIQTSVTTDAANFSTNHAPFQQLEDLDKENIAAARTTLAQIKAMIAEYNEDIEVDTIKAEKDLAIASNAMKYGGKLGKPGKIVGLTIGLIFIVSATFAIDDLLAAVDSQLEEAEKEGKYDLLLTSLSAQLIALETASSALADSVQEIGDMISSLQETIDGWNDESNNLAAVISDLQGDQPVSLIINLFDLGQTQAQYDELRIFATKWQTMEVSPKATNDLVLGDTDT